MVSVLESKYMGEFQSSFQTDHKPEVAIYYCSAVRSTHLPPSTAPWQPPAFPHPKAAVGTPHILLMVGMRRSRSPGKHTGHPYNRRPHLTEVLGLWVSTVLCSILWILPGLGHHSCPCVPQHKPITFKHHWSIIMLTPWFLSFGHWYWLQVKVSLELLGFFNLSEVIFLYLHGKCPTFTD